LGGKLIGYMYTVCPKSPMKNQINIFKHGLFYNTKYRNSDWMSQNSIYFLKKLKKIFMHEFMSF